MDVGNNYNLNITKDIAQKMYDELKKANKLTKEELLNISGGGYVIFIFGCDDYIF